jgi:hypothetical protein
VIWKHLYSRHILLNLALFEVVHVDMDTICARVSFSFDNVYAANVPSASWPVGIIVAAGADGARIDEY